MIHSTLALTASRSNSYDDVCLHRRGRARRVGGKPLMGLFFPVEICDLRRIDRESSRDRCRLLLALVSGVGHVLQVNGAARTAAQELYHYAVVT